ncbi:hypothetical protein L2E82_36773 [Cichorium intybus]|uniref:Uncharacterized protein n=1 Tax=Cichorium intybus TaxID=13427 RepID=A0ACB9ADE4_CICIN|nr:hypothetical protein L2E82_36773 [Cichorium intybus]
MFTSPHRGPQELIARCGDTTSLSLMPCYMAATQARFNVRFGSEEDREKGSEFLDTESSFLSKILAAAITAQI